jgi:hypothetical protein
MQTFKVTPHRGLIDPYFIEAPSIADAARHCTHYATVTIRRVELQKRGPFVAWAATGFTNPERYRK